MSGRIEQLPLLGLLLPALTLLALVSVSGTPDHLVAVLALAGALALGGRAQGGVPVAVRLVSGHHRAEVCRHAGVRSADPDRPGRARPRAPGLG